MSSIFQEFVAGWWGGNFTPELSLYFCLFLGVAGLLVGHPFDTVKVSFSLSPPPPIDHTHSL